ncbi:MAG: GNAT family N-acyltransferase [Victivallales bacterium]
MILNRYSIKHIVSPSVLLETSQFVVKLAENEEEIKKALRLRYEIFNVEQGKGLQECNRKGIDSDEFDEFCLHLLVIEKGTAQVIGTYRVHLGSIANTARGFYSSREYDIYGLREIANYCMELGRSCVAPKYRTGAIVGLMWGGIGELLNRTDLRFMLGCVSMEALNPACGWALYRYFQKEHIMSEILTSRPRKGYELEHPSEQEVQRLLSDEIALKKHIPPLFKGYLRIGCKICGEPALDHEFKTIDFLIIVDKQKVPERYIRHFKSE